MVLGSLSKEEIRDVIQRHLREVKTCYEKALADKPSLHGKLVMRFTIGPDGKVTKANPTEASTLADAALTACVQARGLSWVFPAPKGGGIVIVTYPFVFNTSQ